MIELGEAYLTLARPADAEARFRAALDKKPDARNARVDLGAALEAQNKLDEARAQYDQVADEEPKYPGILERQARLAVQAGAQGRGGQAVRRGAQDGRADAVAAPRRRRSSVLDPAIGRRDDARKLAEAVVADDERSAAAHLLIARDAAARTGTPRRRCPRRGARPRSPICPRRTWCSARCSSR